MLIVGVLMAIAVAGYRQARLRGSEASAIGSLVADQPGPVRVSCRPAATSGSRRPSRRWASHPGDAAFLSPDLTGGDQVEKSGYRFVMDGAEPLEPRLQTCTGVTPVEGYQVTADPVAAGRRAIGSSGPTPPRGLRALLETIQPATCRNRRAARRGTEIKSTAQLTRSHDTCEDANCSCVCAARSRRVARFELRALQAADGRRPTPASATSARTVSCTQAYLSRYGSFRGVPVAIGGVLFFALVLALAGIAGRTPAAAGDTAPATSSRCRRSASPSCSTSAGPSYFVLGAFCILCAITYVSVIAIFHHLRWSHADSHDDTARSRRRATSALSSSPLALAHRRRARRRRGHRDCRVPARSAPRPASGAGAAAGGPGRGAQPSWREWWDVQPQVELPISADGAKV